MLHYDDIAKTLKVPAPKSYIICLGGILSIYVLSPSAYPLAEELILRDKQPTDGTNRELLTIFILAVIGLTLSHK
jgi:hypothetical protein